MGDVQGRGKPTPGVAGKVLVVDDDPIIRKLIAAVAKAVGCATSEVSDGEEALAMVESRGFDLVILDLMLPTVSGHDVLKRLDPELGCSVIVVTASADHDVARLDSPLICDVVRKPFDVHHLGAVIAKALGVDPPESGIGSGERLPVRRSDAAGADQTTPSVTASSVDDEVVSDVPLSGVELDEDA